MYNCSHTMDRIKSILLLTLFRIARSPFGHTIVQWGFRFMTALIPVNTIVETDLVIAFHHPQPAHAVHILIVPKRKVQSLLELRDNNLLSEIFVIARQLVEDMQLSKSGYRLLVNGGKYQEVRQLHFHLISDGSR